MNELTRVIEAAADELPGAIAEFYRVLMKSRVYIPVNSEPKKETPILGQLEAGTLGFLSVPGGDEDEIIPFFSEPGYVADWADREMFYAECEFRAMLWLIGDRSTLHLNPGQEVGKEISRWEIDQLRRGEGAIEELVAELEGAEDEDLLLQPAGPEFDALKRKLLPVLEIAEELEAAFLVVAQEEESGRTSPTLGLKYRAAVSPERKEYFRQEFERCSREHLPADSGMTILDDLEDRFSENWGLFEDVTPFYVATVRLGEDAADGPPGEESAERSSIARQLWKHFGNFRSENDEES